MARDTTARFTGRIIMVPTDLVESMEKAGKFGTTGSLIKTPARLCDIDGDPICQDFPSQIGESRFTYVIVRGRLESLQFGAGSAPFIGKEFSATTPEELHQRGREQLLPGLPKKEYPLVQVRSFAYDRYRAFFDTLAAANKCHFIRRDGDDVLLMTTPLARQQIAEHNGGHIVIKNITTVQEPVQGRRMSGLTRTLLGTQGWSILEAAFYALKRYRCHFDGHRALAISPNEYNQYKDFLHRCEQNRFAQAYKPDNMAYDGRFYAVAPADGFALIAARLGGENITLLEMGMNALLERTRDTDGAAGTAQRFHGAKFWLFGFDDRVTSKENKELLDRWRHPGNTQAFFLGDLEEGRWCWVLSDDAFHDVQEKYQGMPPLPFTGANLEKAANLREAVDKARKHIAALSARRPSGGPSKMVSSLRT